MFGQEGERAFPVLTSRKTYKIVYTKEVRDDLVRKQFKVCRKLLIRGCSSIMQSVEGEGWGIPNAHFCVQGGKAGYSK